MAAGHLGHSLLQGDFVLYFAVELNAGDLIDGDFLLHDDIFERKSAFDRLVILDAPFVQLEGHFFGLEGLAHLQVDELFELFALEGRIHIEVAGLLVGQNQQDLRQTFRQQALTVHSGEQNWLILFGTHF